MNNIYHKIIRGISKSLYESLDLFDDEIKDNIDNSQPTIGKYFEIKDIDDELNDRCIDYNNKDYNTYRYKHKTNLRIKNHNLYSKLISYDAGAYNHFILSNDTSDWRKYEGKYFIHISSNNITRIITSKSDYYMWNSTNCKQHIIDICKQYNLTTYMIKRYVPVIVKWYQERDEKINNIQDDKLRKILKLYPEIIRCCMSPDNEIIIYETYSYEVIIAYVEGLLEERQNKLNKRI